MAGFDNDPNLEQGCISVGRGFAIDARRGADSGRGGTAMALAVEAFAGRHNHATND